MDRDVPGQALVLHALPGRLRLHVPRWPAPDAPRLEQRLRRLPGVTYAHANPLTGNVLILYNPAATHPGALLTGLDGLPPAAPGPRRRPSFRRARYLARMPLTSRYLGLALFDQFAGQTAPFSAPGAACRLFVALAGLGLLACRRLARWRRLTARFGPVGLVLDALVFLQRRPAVRDLLDRALGRRPAGILREVTAVAALLLSGSPVGLAFAGVEALFHLSRAPGAA